MVEINNQRKAFLDMLAWSERGTDNGRQKTRNHEFMTSLWAESYLLITPITLANLSRAKPQNSNQQALGRYQLLSRWWDAYRKQLGLKDFSPKSQDAVALQQIKERGALPMIDRGDIRQAIDRCSNIWASLPGAGYGQFEHKADSLIAKIQRSGRNGQRLMYEQSHRDYLRSDLSASSSACHGLLIITVITPLPTKPSYKKCRELKLANAAITDMQMRQRDVADSGKIHGG